jgi:hypothetical protein
MNKTAREFWEDLVEYKKTHEDWNMNDLIRILEARDEFMRQRGYMQRMCIEQAEIDEKRVIIPLT